MSAIGKTTAEVREFHRAFHGLPEPVDGLFKPVHTTEVGMKRADGERHVFRYSAVDGLWHEVEAD